MDTGGALFGIVFLGLVLITLGLLNRQGSSCKVSVKRRETKRIKESRKEPRYRTSIRARYQTPIEEGISWIKDISLSGAHLFLNRAVDIGTSLKIEVTLPQEDRPIRVEGDIVWAEECNAGFRFVGAEEDEITKLIEYIKARDTYIQEQ